MDAPQYPPAAEFIAPQIMAEPLNANTTPLSILLANPAAKAVLLAEIPYLDTVLASEALRPHLSNFSPRSLTQFGLFAGPALDRVDRKLRALNIQSGAGQ